MNKDFKTLIAPFLFEGKEFCPQFLNHVEGWPTLKVMDVWNPDEEEELSSENVSYIESTPNSLTLGINDLKLGRYIATFTVIGGEVVLEFLVKQDFEENDNTELKLMFEGIKTSSRPIKKNKPVWVYQMELNKALKNEDFATAALIRDQMKELGYEIKNS